MSLPPALLRWVTLWGGCEGAEMGGGGVSLALTAHQHLISRWRTSPLYCELYGLRANSAGCSASLSSVLSFFSQV